MAGKLQKNFFSSFLTSPNFAILTDFFTLFVRGGILAQINKANFIFFLRKKDWKCHKWPYQWNFIVH